MPVMAYNEAMPAATTLSRLTRIATDQWGLITRAQAGDAGVPPRTFARLAESESLLRRVAPGVYQVVGAPAPDHLELRAAWLRLAPAVPAWKRSVREGVVSHRSAAVLYELGHLPADRHEFTVEDRKQTRRRDVRIHRGRIEAHEWAWRRGLPVTRPDRIVADLIREREESDAIAAVLSDALRGGLVSPADVVDELVPIASSEAARGEAAWTLFESLLNLVPSPENRRWLQQARDPSASRHSASSRRS